MNHGRLRQSMAFTTSAYESMEVRMCGGTSFDSNIYESG